MKFIKQILASFIGTFLSLFACLIVLPIVLLIALLTFLISNGEKIEEQIEPPANSYACVFNLATQIKEFPSYQTINFSKNTFLDNTYSTYKICSAIDASLENSKLLFVHGKLNPNTTLAQVEEIRKALALHAKNKKVIIYLENPTQIEYYLATSANEIILNPASDFTLKGIASVPTFFGDTLKKYGVQAQVVKSGAYKNLGNMFTENKLSSTDKQHLQQLLDNLWQNLLVSISKSRNIPIENLKNIASISPIITAKQAKDLRLVDKLCYSDEVVTMLQNLCGKNKDSFNSYPLENYSIVENITQPNVAVVYMSGDIVDEGNYHTISAKYYVPILRKLRFNKNISGVVLRIDSGGGSAYASELIRREVELLAKEKPVVVSAGSMCASGAYWISTSAHKIYADNTSIVGSIGVISLMFSIKELANDFGITFDTVKTEPYADIFSSAKKASPQELEKIQTLVDNTYERFVQLVAKSRSMSIEQAKQLADGRVYTGQQSINLKLVDGVKQLKDIVQNMANTTNAYSVKEYPQIDIMKDFFNNLEDGSIFANTPFKFFLETKNFVKHFDKKNGIYAEVPFKLTIK
ncbi:MAG: signal peptide peptidase SppA [Verrucomicrobiaceae bacterium]|nr:signal peptide peptidase SppA [Verrucomicrobiaceae bacterium]